MLIVIYLCEQIYLDLSMSETKDFVLTPSNPNAIYRLHTYR